MLFHDMDAARRLARHLGADLFRMIDMYRTGHPEVLETVANRVGTMDDERRAQMLLLAIALLADDHPLA